MAKEQNKKTYGEFGNVKLTDEDLAVLQERYPQDYADYIERLTVTANQPGKSIKTIVQRFKTGSGATRRAESSGIKVA